MTNIRKITEYKCGICSSRYPLEKTNKQTEYGDILRKEAELMLSLIKSITQGNSEKIDSLVHEYIEHTGEHIRYQIQHKKDIGWDLRQLECRKHQIDSCFRYNGILGHKEFGNYSVSVMLYEELTR